MAAASSPKNRACVLSTHTAQAFANARCTGHGLTTVMSRRWTWCWQVGGNSTRVARTSVPPWTRHARWGRCPPVAVVIAWSPIGERPVCSHPRCASFQRPCRSAGMCRPLRAATEGSPCGSYGWAWLQRVRCPRIRVARLAASRTVWCFPAGWGRVTPHAPLRDPLCRPPLCQLTIAL